MTDDERRAYARGYSATSRRWPAHRPPTPPDPVVGRLVSALRALRDAVDTSLATFPPDDEIRDESDPHVEEARAVPPEHRATGTFLVRFPEPD